MKNFKKGISLIAVIAFLITAILPVTVLATDYTVTDGTVTGGTLAYSTGGSTGTAVPAGGVSDGTLVTITGSPSTPGQVIDTLTVKNDDETVPTTKISDTIYTFTMPEANVTVDATFAAAGQAYTVTDGTVTGGTLAYTTGEDATTPVPQAGVTKDTLVTITGSPATAGQIIDTLTVKNGDETVPTTKVSGNVYTFAMPEADVTVDATFAAAYTVTDGTVTGGTLAHTSGDPAAAVPVDGVVADTKVTITGSPTTAGQVIDTLTVKNGDETVPTTKVSDNVYTFTMPEANVTVDATFAAAGQAYTVTDGTVTGGTLAYTTGDPATTPVPQAGVTKDTLVTITGSPATAGQIIDTLTVKNGDETVPTTKVSDNVYTFTMPEADVTVDATFAAPPATYTVTDGTVTGGTLAYTSGDPAADVPVGGVEAGTKVTITGSPTTAGQVIDTLTVKNGDETVPTTKVSDNVYTFTMPEANVTVDATFAAAGQTYTVTDGTVTGGTLAYTTGDPATTPVPQAGVTKDTLVTITGSPATAGQIIDTLTVKNGDETVPTTKVSDNVYTFTMPEADVTVDATFAAPSATYTVTDGTVTGGTLAYTSGDPAAAVPVGGVEAGTKVTITGSPTTAGQVIDTLTVKNGDETVTTTKVSDNVYTFTMPEANVTVDATFAAAGQTYTVTDGTVTGGTLAYTTGDPATTPVPQAGVTKDTLVTITGSPATAGQIIDTLTVKNGDETVPTAKVSDNVYTFTMPEADVTVDATFAAPSATYTVTDGTVTGGTLAYTSGDPAAAVPVGGVEAGTKVTITGSPTTAGQVIDTLTVKNGDETVTTMKVSDNVYTFTMPEANVTVDATFAAAGQTYTVTDGTVTGGTLAYTTGDPATTPVPQAGVTKDTLVTITGSPATAGQIIDTLTVKNGDETVPTTKVSDNVYTFTMPEADVTVDATFAAPPATYTVTDGTVTGGTLAYTSGDPAAAVPVGGVEAGTKVTITGNPTTAGQVIDTLTVKNGDETVTTTKVSDNVYTFTMPEANVTVDATFAAAGQTYTVTDGTVTGGTLAYTTGDPATTPVPQAGVTKDTLVTITGSPATAGQIIDTLTVKNGDETVPTTKVSDNVYTFTMPEGNVTVDATFVRATSIVFSPASGTATIAAGSSRVVYAGYRNETGALTYVPGRWSVPDTETNPATGNPYTLADFGITDPTANPVTITVPTNIGSGAHALIFTPESGSQAVATFTFTVPATTTAFSVSGQEVNDYGNEENAPEWFDPDSAVTVLENNTDEALNPTLRVAVQGSNITSAADLANTRFFWSANSDQLTLAHMQTEYTSRVLNGNGTPTKPVNADGVNLCDGTVQVTESTQESGIWYVDYQLTDDDVSYITAYTSGASAAPRARTLPYLFYRPLVVPGSGPVTAENVAGSLTSSGFRASWTEAPGLTLRAADQQDNQRDLYDIGEQVDLSGLWAPQIANPGTTAAQQPVWTLDATTASASDYININDSAVQLSGNYPQTLNVTETGVGTVANPFSLTLNNLPAGTYTFGLTALDTSGVQHSAQIQIQVASVQTGTGCWSLENAENVGSGKLLTYNTEAGAANPGWNTTNTINVASNNRFTIYVPVVDSFGNHINARSVSKVWEYRTSAAEGGANGIAIPAGNGFYGVNAEQLRSTPVTADMNGWQFRLTAQSTDGSTKAVSDWFTINVTDAGAIAEIPQVTVTTAPESVASTVTATQTADVTFTADVQNSIAANNLSYQWQSRAAATAQTPNPQWANIAGATAKTYTLENVASSMAGTQFRCVVTNNAFSTGINGTSNALTLAVNTQAGAIIISSPTAASLRNLYASRTADFAVTARTDNGDPVTYQWFVKGVPGPVVGGNVTNITEAAAYLANAPVTVVSGATSASYTTGALEEGVYEYVCRVTNQNNGALTQNSAGFYLVVTQLSRQPQITSPAPNTTTQVGTPAGKAITFNCDAHVQSQETLTYQWQASQNGVTGWADLPNQTAASFTLPNPAGENSGWYYRCVVTNAAANESSISGSYQLTVWNTADVPVVGAINPQSWEGSLTQANEAGVTLKSTAAAPSGAALTAVWQFKPAGGDWKAVDNQPAQSYNAASRQWESVYELPTDEKDSNNNNIYSETRAQALNGQYRCVWTNGSAGINGGVSGTSLAPFAETGACTVNIIVPGAPRITAEPSDATAAVGTTATFAVGAILNPNPNVAVQGTLVYVWQMSSDGGETWKNVLSTDASGQFTNTLSVPVTQTMYDNETAANIAGKSHVYKYRVNVANRASGLNTYSDAVNLTVTPGSVSEPVITPGADSPIKIEGTGADKVATGVTGTKDGITVKDYLDTLGYAAPAGYTLRIVNAEGEQIADDAIVCTGYKLELVKASDNTVVDSATIIVTGDVLGTGQINIAQLVRMARDLNGVEALTGVYLQAGDFNGTGNIDIADLVAEARIINETIDIM